MLLYHGTSGDRALVEKVLAEGLLAHGGRDWAGTLTGVDGHMFVCTTPIGTRDGDPIRWAERSAARSRRSARGSWSWRSPSCGRPHTALGRAVLRASSRS